ncbi:hypothetical protein N0V94_004257 [Neodidymelliopsis sp. IMI 364377]|nr:hypothetical protein N0V94_004257 [Neodidymelliopsis sp. IMI 364377]
MPISRQKKLKYKENKVIKPPKTSRTEMPPTMRAFLCGAITAMRGGYVSLGDLAKQVNRDQSGLSKLYQRVEQKAEDLSLQLWDNILSENNLGRGRSALLTQEQKDAIITLVTSTRNNREQESWQAIAHGVKHNRNRKDCALQFYRSFRYNHKGPCHVYYEETEAEKKQAEVVLKRENEDTQVRENKLQLQARQSLTQMGESDINKRYNTQKKHAPAHKSRISRNYLTVKRIQTLWWPSHSPKVNAIKHAWPWVQRHVTKDFTPSCNKKQCEKQ